MIISSLSPSLFPAKKPEVMLQLKRGPNRSKKNAENEWVAFCVVLTAARMTI